MGSCGMIFDWEFLLALVACNVSGIYFAEQWMLMRKHFVSILDSIDQSIKLFKS